MLADMILGLLYDGWGVRAFPEQLVQIADIFAKICRFFRVQRYVIHNCNHKQKVLQKEYRETTLSTKIMLKCNDHGPFISKFRHKDYIIPQVLLIATYQH